MATAEKTMRAAQVKAFGEIDQVLMMTDSCPIPTLRPPLSAVPNAGADGEKLIKKEENKKKKKPVTHVLVKVLACSLSPGDCRMLGGYKDIMCTPEKLGSSWPYIPGLDVCGEVTELDPNDDSGRFKVGDRVVGTWDTVGMGGMAEYALVRTDFAATIPKDLTISDVEGAALANSASHALNILDRAAVKSGERVLIIGGSGGLGTLLIQLCKSIGASYVCAVSSDTELCRSLGAHRAVDYRTELWSDVAEFKKDPFDVVLDLAVGVQAWKDARRSGVLKSGGKGGRFVAVVLNEWHIVIHKYYQLFGFILPPLFRQMSSWFTSFFTPRYKMYIGTANAESIEKVFGALRDRRIGRVVVDKESPHPFTLEGVKAAFRRQESRRGKGKVVVDMSKRE
eukprot:CAMPEP_0114128624 /NCGR_PEP_ID=MMETSP0043_2-20121206/11034_1 /TAXON_ID=464988 /ORGANISM="Hemiselmis andersenii, Strain CCMP644" /LENGTH=394 /DNA_ID=CAMNT_0001221831 /DNA_START=137 /DNA_END=1321 /DNA_ORIENTATION=-